jgi:hypothetical protein
MYYLKGCSGCTLKLLPVGDVTVVRKISSSINYNNRLIKQYKKQKNFKHNLFLTPKIFNSGYCKDLFFFDMEYINGVRLADYISKISISTIEHLVSPLISLIPQTWDPIGSTDVFEIKLSELSTLLKSIKINFLPQTIDILKKTEWSEMPRSTLCHGDLTFENIILKDNNFYLIDFLDSFYESWIIDLSKIFQDIELNWAYRYIIINENLNLRLLIIRQLINQFIQEHSKNKTLQYLLHRLLMLNILRVIPYTTKIDIPFIEYSLEYLCKKY